MTLENNPTTDRSKLGQAKRHILTYKNGIPLSADITSVANKHGIKAVTYVIYNSVINRSFKLSFTKKKTRR